MKTPTKSAPRTLSRWVLAMSVAAGLVALAHAHGDVTPQAVDTSTLPALGEKWLSSNPYTPDVPEYKEALRIGTSAYNQNCARCHGLQAISGGISPDLRKFDQECSGLADEGKKQECFKEMDDYFLSTVRRGRVRDGRVYMPPFEKTLSQEAIWTIKTYITTRREP
ncbi:MAG: cytochrome c-550 PedF [Burkholderiaceae bacterium]